MFASIISIKNPRSGKALTSWTRLRRDSTPQRRRHLAERDGAMLGKP